MKASLFRRLLVGALFGAMVCWSIPAHADDDANLLKQAEGLVHDVLNPGGDMLTGDDAIAKLKKAKDLTIAAPQRFRHGTRRKAIDLIEAAIAELKNGGDPHQAYSAVRDADEMLREAITEST